MLLELDLCQRYDFGLSSFYFATNKRINNEYSSFLYNQKIVLIALYPEKEDKTHYGFYASSAITYLLAMVSSNMALRWLPYPTQVIGKSAKPIPVMLLGVLIGRKSYSIQRYCFVLLIVAGVVLFMMKDGKTSGVANDQMVGIGEVLLILSLSMDGLTGAIQERMRAAHAPTANHMMLSMNGWSSVFVGVALVFSGEVFEFIAFASRYPHVLYQLALLAITGSLGQLFIFIMVASFGPLPCSIVTTTRKFFTVLFSVIFIGNPLSSKQWFGAVLVFAGLFADAAFGKSSGKKISKDDKDAKSSTEKLLGNHR